MYYSVYLDLQDRPAVVVGGGSVAARKVEGLLEAGARLTVIAPALNSELRQRAERGEFRWEERIYRAGDLSGAVLAIAGTSDPGANEAVYLEAKGAGIPVNVVDDPPHCTFILPAVLRRGELAIAISTGGASPALAQVIRDRVAEVIGPEYGDVLGVLGEARGRVLAAVADPERRKQLFKSLASTDLVEVRRAGGPEALRNRVEEFLKEEGL